MARGRRCGDSGSRDAILAAAQELFAARGYSGTTVRAVAARAGVDPALIAHFFKDKAGLFATVAQRAAAFPATLLEVLTLTRHPEDVGERLTRAYLTAWEHPDTAGPLLATTRSALTDDESMDQLRGLLLPRALRRAAGLLAADAPELRMTLAMSHLHGIAMARHVIKEPPLVTPSLEELVPVVAPVVQHYLTGPLPEPSAGTTRGAVPPHVTTRPATSSRL